MNMLNDNNFNQNEKKDTEFFEKTKKGKGFYIAMAICVLAVSAAGVTTYKSIKEFSEITENNTANEAAERAQSHVGEKKALDFNKSILEKTEDSKVDDLRKALHEQKTETPATSDGLKKKVFSEDEIQAVSGVSPPALLIHPTGSSEAIKNFSSDKPIYSQTLSDWRTHEGVDFKADEGSAVKAITAGTVKDVFYDPSYGKTAVIDHDLGFSAFYCGLQDDVKINKNDKVAAEQEIGHVGKVPVEIADGPHLHLMISRSGKFIDPMTIFK